MPRVGCLVGGGGGGGGGGGRNTSPKNLEECWPPNGFLILELLFF